VRKLPGISANDVTAAGSHVWSVGYTDDSVTEIDAVSGKVLRTRSEGYHFNFLSGIAVHGKHAWITNDASVAELAIG
jgi:hypothetical protein